MADTLVLLADLRSEEYDPTLAASYPVPKLAIDRDNCGCDLSLRQLKLSHYRILNVIYMK